MSNWSLEVTIVVKEDEQKKSRTLHEVFDLDNEAADTGAEQVLMKLVGQVKEWQAMKKAGKTGSR